MIHYKLAMELSDAQWNKVASLGVIFDKGHPDIPAVCDDEREEIRAFLEKLMKHLSDEIGGGKEPE